MAANILIVEDESSILELISLNLHQAGFNPIRAISAEYANNLVKETIQNAKKAAPSKSDEKGDAEDIKTKSKEKSTKTVQELDREKLDAKFLKKKKEKLN